MVCTNWVCGKKICSSLTRRPSPFLPRPYGLGRRNVPARAPVKPSAPPQKPLIGRAPSLLNKKQKTRTSAGGDDAQTNIASVKPIGIRGVGAATSGNKLCAHVNTGRGKLNDREPRKGKVDADVSGIAPRYMRQTCPKSGVGVERPGPPRPATSAYIIARTARRPGAARSVARTFA